MSHDELIVSRHVDLSKQETRQFTNNIYNGYNPFSMDTKPWLVNMKEKKRVP